MNKSLAAVVLFAGVAGFGMAPAAAAQSACESLGGTVDAAAICHVDSAGAGFRFEASFPAGYPDQQALTDYLSGERDRMADYAAKIPPTGRGSGYELAITGKPYHSGTPVGGTQSVVFGAQNDSGVANEGRPATIYIAFNYDLGRGAPITFATLFKPGTTPADVQAAAPDLPAPDDFGVHGYRNFALTDEAVVVFIDQDFLHAGPRSVSVPRTALAALLA